MHDSYTLATRDQHVSEHDRHLLLARTIIRPGGAGAYCQPYWTPRWLSDVTFLPGEP